MMQMPSQRAKSCNQSEAAQSAWRTAGSEVSCIAHWTAGKAHGMPAALQAHGWGTVHLLCGIAEALVHVGGDAPVPQEVDHPVAEVAEGPVQIPQLHRRHSLLSD